MSNAILPDVPEDFARRIKTIRGRKGLTQTQFAELLGVSFASVNRWENEQSRPAKLAWQKILELERPAAKKPEPVAIRAPEEVSLDFSARPEAVAAVAEAQRLAYGHLFNPAFAAEISLIDPLPHQRIAVYEQMLRQSPLRFLLADDAGAGKTIMTGLYVREMLSRRLIKRVLIVPPAGLVGNWEREMRTLFRMQFRVITGADARNANPFTGQDSNLVVVSVDTLSGERMFNRLKEAADNPYDLVVFDEAHKLAADREPDFRVRKTDRYKLAEALAGIGSDDARWALGWHSTHLLLLTATPHMGKDYPYYFLWRLLLPEALSTFEAFSDFSAQLRAKHFIRRTKEEMVRFDGTPLYPERNCDTLSYNLSPEEQDLYRETTEYIRTYYNRARILNRSAARLAMSVFQRRLASSTYALMRSFERRVEKLEAAIALVRDGRAEDFARDQRKLDDVDDFFDTLTADEDLGNEGEGERHEDFEDKALGGTVAVTLAELEAERLQVEGLLVRARKLFEAGEESKFEKLREVLRDPDFSDDKSAGSGFGRPQAGPKGEPQGWGEQKFIIFTEHRDTAHFLVRRLEGLGFTGQVARIDGGMNYLQREQQVEFFRRPIDQGGARYLVATDAAGEGINLQFCWLMVNYDIPWNPARLEQRMGRIHRYGQKHDPVIIVNLVAGQTREGRVLRTLLDKLEAIRKQLKSDKVFDVVGRLFEGVSLKQYLEQAVTEEGAEDAAEKIVGRLTEEQVRALEEKEHRIYGEGGDVKRVLSRLNHDMEQEQYLRLLPGYVRRFVERAAPLLNLAIDGDLDDTFVLSPQRPGALDALLPFIELYPESIQNRLSVRKPADADAAIWLHPGESIFDCLSRLVVGRYSGDALRGAVFVDPTAQQPYLFHLALVSVDRGPPSPQPSPAERKGVSPLSTRGRGAGGEGELMECRLVGLTQFQDGSVKECPVEHMLLLRGARDYAPSRAPLAAFARALKDQATAYARDHIGARLVEQHRAQLTDTLPERLDFVSRGFDHHNAELATARNRLTEKARMGDARAKADLANVKERQKSLHVLRDIKLAELKREPDLLRVGAVEFLAHALVVPSDDPEERKRFDAEVERVAMKVAIGFEESLGATVHDVHKPELARSAGLTDWPGFDLLSHRAQGESRAIEVKGRADEGPVEISDNEWAKAINLRDRYWLYVVFNCATPAPRLLRIQDPFGKLLVRQKGSFIVNEQSIWEAAEE